MRKTLLRKVTTMEKINSIDKKYIKCCLSNFIGLPGTPILVLVLCSLSHVTEARISAWSATSISKQLEKEPRFERYVGMKSPNVKSRPSVKYGPHIIPSTFDDLSFGTEIVSDISQDIDIVQRLGKLDSVFNSLRLSSEDCRRRLICEVSKDAESYSPLAEIFQHETKLNRDIRSMGRELLESAEGTRLLTYIEACSRGKDRFRECDIYRYRCNKSARQLIDMDSLFVWKEVVGWLTVKVLANGEL